MFGRWYKNVVVMKECCVKALVFQYIHCSNSRIFLISDVLYQSFFSQDWWSLFFMWWKQSTLFLRFKFTDFFTAITSNPVLTCDPSVRLFKFGLFKSPFDLNSNVCVHYPDFCILKSCCHYREIHLRPTKLLKLIALKCCSCI